MHVAFRHRIPGYRCWPGTLSAWHATLAATRNWANAPVAKARPIGPAAKSAPEKTLTQQIAADTSGAAAVEFAIVVSLFLALSFRILAYGIYLGAAHGVSQLAADAARASVAGLTDVERTNLAQAHVNKNAADFMLLTREKLVVEAAPSPNDANQFQVIVRFDAADLPIWFMSSFVPLPSKTIVRSASIKRGGY
jgi:Flp pilus assembly protein TadG